MSTIIVSAGFSGLIAIFASVCIERFGGRLGGLLGSLPTTIIPASIGFWLAATSTEEAKHALYAVPPGMMVTACFLLCWRLLPHRLPMTSLGIRLFWMTFISLGAWTLAATVMVLGVQHIPLPMSLIGFSTFVLQLGVGTWACINNPPAPKGNNDVRLPVYVARGCLAAAAIGVSVWMSSLGIPLLAGIFSVFPAIFLTAMVSVWLSQGQAVQAGAVGPLILGSASVSAFSIGSALFVPITNVTLGTFAAWFCAVGFVSVPAWLWLKRQTT